MLCHVQVFGDISVLEMGFDADSDALNAQKYRTYTLKQYLAHYKPCCTLTLSLAQTLSVTYFIEQSLKNKI